MTDPCDNLEPLSQQEGKPKEGTAVSPDLANARIVDAIAGDEPEGAPLIVASTEGGIADSEFVREQLMLARLEGAEKTARCVAWEAGRQCILHVGHHEHRFGDEREGDDR